MANVTYAQLSEATDVEDTDLLASYRGSGPLKRLLFSTVLTYLGDTFLRLDGDNSPMTGPLQLFKGDVSSPGASFDGDADTGFYWIGANRLGVATGGVLRGFWDSTGYTASAPVNYAAYADVTSAATCDIGAATSNYVRITGSTGPITSLGTAAEGVVRQVLFASTPTLTYHATALILPGAANIVAAAGDTAKFVSLGSGNWRCEWYTAAAVSPISRGAPEPPQGRVTLTSGVPVTTADVTGATTVYYTPFVGGFVPIYSGSVFAMTAFTELSQATTDATKSPAAVANNSNYDVFVWSDSGTLRATRGPAWTSDTGRGTGAGTTELVMVAGVLLNANAITNGPGASRGTYVGSIRSNGSAQIVDSLAFRYVFNAYNQRRRAMKVVETTATWNYTTGTFRPLNNSTANAISFLDGLGTQAVRTQVGAVASNTTAGTAVVVGVGLDSTSVNSADLILATTCVVNTYLVSPTAVYEGVPGLGKHTLTALEWSGATGTTTWYGANVGLTLRSGITGALEA